MSWSLKPYNIVLCFSKRMKHVPEYLSQCIFANMLVHISLDLQSLSKFFLITFLESKGVNWFHNHFPISKSPLTFLPPSRPFLVCPEKFKAVLSCQTPMGRLQGKRWPQGEKKLQLCNDCLDNWAETKVSPENSAVPRPAMRYNGQVNGIWS